jgi:hypothetical protein
MDPALMRISSSVVVQAIMNVPLSTVMLSNGGALLMLLWLISPNIGRGITARSAMATSGTL